jgi:hypothetical protein
MQTFDRTIPNNKPDILIRDNENGTCLKNDVISGDTNVTKKAEMILKYKDLITETQRMWYIIAKVIPVTMKSFLSITRKYLSNITGKHEIEKLQTTAAVRARARAHARTHARTHTHSLSLCGNY